MLIRYVVLILFLAAFPISALADDLEVPAPEVPPSCTPGGCSPAELCASEAEKCYSIEGAFYCCTIAPYPGTPVFGE